MDDLSISKKKWETLNNSEIKNTDDLIEVLIKNRGIKNRDAFLNIDFKSGCYSPLLIPDMKKALDRIYIALKKNEKVSIYGDYDVDGVTSTALIFNLLKDIGIKQIKPYIPSRFNEGYGMNEKAVKEISKESSLLITVDCGITNHKEIEIAKKNNLDVIVTDHHEIIGEIPKAVAVINPKVKSSKYPFKFLAGVGVAFKLAQAVYQDSRFQKTLIKGHEKWLLDLVALGTIADCMPLVDENRTLVHYGLIVLNKTKRQGLTTLIQKSGLQLPNVNSTDVGFRIGPRINAAGRLGHAKDALNLITATDLITSDKLVNLLETLNYDRRNYSFRISDQIKNNYNYQNSPAIIASSPEWEEGVIGLVAGDLAQTFHKPVILFTEKKDKYVGSARSYNDDINLAQVLYEFKDLLIKFGGHSKAAGLTLKSINYNKVKKALNKRFRDFPQWTPKLTIDAELPENVITLQNVNRLKLLEPYGQANPSPVFLKKNVKINNMKLVGESKNHLKVNFQIGRAAIDSIAFNWGEHFKKLDRNRSYDIVFEPIINFWNNHENLNLKIIDMKSHK